MWLIHICIVALISAQYGPRTSASLGHLQPALFWPEHHIPMDPPPSRWLWPGPPPPAERYPNPYHEPWPAAAGLADYEAPFPHRAPPVRFDQMTPNQPTSATEVTPGFGFGVPTIQVKPVLKPSSTPNPNQSEWISDSVSSQSQRPTQPSTASTVPVTEATSTTEGWTFPPTTPDPIQVKIQLSGCINNCVTDKSIKSVCGSDNKTYQNRQYLDCAQKCGQNIRLDYTGRCIPNPPSA